ncbi:MAG TPA: lipoate--protein ligase [Bacteroidales bacterium]|nr:lipoate--protein ligase [Bacteroidales bacterium]
MLCIKLRSSDPFISLATEEYLLKNTEEEYFIVGINDPSVIIGKHQVAHREADTEFVTRNNIPVIRRISGGGTVYHDSGNINFSFILRSAKGRQVDFRKYVQPVIEFLASVNITAEFGGKNDLKSDGFKISGNAEHIFRERVLHHGTLLINADIDTMKRSLRKDTSCYLTRAVHSNPAPVMNLKGKLSERMDAEEFSSQMWDFFLNEKENHPAILSPEAETGIRSLVNDKYKKWEWNYAYGPGYIFTGRFQINNISYSCSMSVAEGIIRECDIEGSGEITRIGKSLSGCRHMPGDMMKIFLDHNIPVSESDIFKFF